MDLGDIKFCQEYFRDVEKRDPTITEMKMIDTYCIILQVKLL